MSAWIVSENHIRLLVEALYKYELVPSPSMTPETLGRILWKENHKSVNYRYGERQRTPRYAHDSKAIAMWEYPSPGTGIIRELVRIPALVYKQASCYQYQSCERDDWETTTASKLIKALTNYLEKRGEDANDDAHPWGIE